MLDESKSSQSAGQHANGPYDAVIIGAGAGGMTAAAYLIAAGKKVLVVESKGNVGGRAASYDVEGFRVNVGAIAVELGGALEHAFSQLNVPLDVREPSPTMAFRLDGKLVDVAKGGWGFLLNTFTKKAAKIGAKIADARSGDLPEDRLSTEEWLQGFTKNKTVHALFRNLSAGVFAANSDELPARAFLTHFGIKGSIRRFGFCPRGTIGIWEDLAAAITRSGSDVLLNTPVTALDVEGDQIVGVTIDTAEGPRRIAARTIISNIGPTATVNLPGAEVFGSEYVDYARTAPRPAPMITMYFATQKPLYNSPSYITFGVTRKLCNIIDLTATCPELAPPGWSMYVAFGVPKPALSDFDEAAEVNDCLQDLRDQFPDGFNDDVKMLNITTLRDGWPAQRSCAGFDLDANTPLPNVWHVGDAVKGYGEGGMPACAVTGRHAAENALRYLDQ